MPERTTSEVAAELQIRVNRYKGTRDVAVVLDPKTHQDAQWLYCELIDHVASGVNATMLVTLARWYWGRYEALPAGRGRSELRSAQMLAALVRDADPLALPPDLRDLLDQPRSMPSPRMAVSNEVALTLLARFDDQGDLASLEQARVLLGSAARLAAPDDPDRAFVLSSVVDVSMSRYIVSGKLSEIDEAVRAAREAVTLATEDALRAFLLGVLGWTLRCRYEHTGELTDLDEALRLVRAAAATAQDDTPDRRLLCLYYLGDTLRARYERTGRLADLDEAVRVSRDVVAASPAGHPVVSHYLVGLMGCLLRRFELLGTIEDGNEAVEVGRRLLAMAPVTGPLRCLYLINHAMALVARHKGASVPGDLDEAVKISREATVAAASYVGYRSWALAVHAIILFARSVDHDSLPDLDQAIQAGRDAVNAMPTDDAWRAIYCSNLANMLVARGRLSRELSYVDEAIELGRRAVAALSPGHPARVNHLYVLAAAFHCRFRISGSSADLDSATGLWRSTISSRVGAVEMRMGAARVWSIAAEEAGEVHLAAESSEAAVRLLPILAWRGLDRSAQEKRLANVSGVASDAAAWAIHIGQYERAVELLEQGRSILWSQVLQTRTDLADLCDAAPELAQRLDQTRQALDDVHQLPLSRSGSAGAANSEPLTHQQRRLAEQWETLVREVRRLPGFDTFLAPTPFERLRPAASEGPVVIVNVSRLRCDALVVTTAGVQVVPLPWLTLGAAYARATVLLAAQREAEASRGPVTRAHFRHTLTSLLRWLWDAVAEPVLRGLEHTVEFDGDGSPPRVWWCPTGPLTLLPLHAAGRHHASSRWQTRRRPTVPDRVISSYTTSLDALLRARARPRPTTPARLLAVGMPQTPGMAPLPWVPDELDRLSAAVPDTTRLVGPDATACTVLGGLKCHRWAHFACHGTLDVHRPSNSAIHLHDRPLTVLQLAAHDLTDAEFAYLSACHTASGTVDLADEAIHPTAALQLAGYRHVIGTQWSITDEHAADVASAVYSELTVSGSSDPANAAVALSRAVTPLRARYSAQPEVWAPFIHTGP